MTTPSPTPDDPTGFAALVALAQRQHRAGQLVEAAVAYRKIVAQRPEIAEVHSGLANVLLRLGRLDEAADQYDQALALDPNLFAAHNELGAIFQLQGKLDQALARFEQALALKPDYAEAHNNLGNVLNAQRKFAAAAARFERAIALKPSLFQAYINLGAILQEQGQLDAAAARFEQAIALRPDSAEAHYNLGNVLKDQGQLDAAVARFQHAIMLKPDLFQAHYNLGIVLRDQEKLEPAVTSFRQAIASKPDYAEAFNNLGGVLKDQGKLDEAATCYERAIAFSPDHAEAYYNRTDLKKFQQGDADLAALESIAACANLPPDKMLYIHFALGKALEDIGDYPRAMEHLLEGNALKRRQIDYDEAAYQKDCRLIVDVFNSKLLDRFPGAGDPSPVPIFVLGMPRSGSTLVEQILASHPQVQAAGELKNLDQVIRAVTNVDGRPMPFSAWIEAADAEELRWLGQAYLASLPPLADGKTRITDKMPGNFLRIGLIRMILPAARIIHTMRDPVDTCLSCFSRIFHDLPFSYDLAELGRYYHRYEEMMAHWRSVLPAGAMLDVSYEDVVENLEEQARRLIEYCGLPWDDRCLSFHKTSRSIATSSNVQVRRPLYRSSLERWRRYEAFLGPLLAELAASPSSRPGADL